MIFISYNREHDGEVAADISAILQRQGYPVWRDSSSIRPGELFEQSISEAIRTAVLFIGILSREACKSRNVEKEWALAGGRGNDLTILPVFLRGLRAEDLRGTFEYHGKSCHHMNVRRVDAEFERALIDAVAAVVGPPGKTRGTAPRDPMLVRREKPATFWRLLAGFALAAAVSTLALSWQSLRGWALNSGSVEAPKEIPDPVVQGNATPNPVAVQPAIPKTPSRIQGLWAFTTNVEASQYKPYLGLISVYRISLFRIPDGRVQGSGELWSEGGEEVVGRNHLPIAFEGVADAEALHLTFRIESTSRPVTGSAQLHWDAAAGAWQGSFYSGAGASSGTATLVPR